MLSTANLNVPSAAKVPILSGQLSRIDSTISGLFDARDRIEKSMSQLFNPRPEPVEAGNAPAQPTANTIETRMQSTIDRLEALQRNLMAIADILDRGV